MSVCHIVGVSSLGAVRGDNGDDNATSAQTERRGAASAGENLAWRRELTGRLSLFLSLSSRGRGFVSAAAAVYYLQCSLFFLWRRSHVFDHRRHLRGRRPEAVPAAATEGARKSHHHRASRSQLGRTDGGPHSLQRPAVDRVGRPGPRTRVPPARGGAMIFTDLPTGASVFVDANTFVYHF